MYRRGLLESLVDRLRQLQVDIHDRRGGFLFCHGSGSLRVIGWTTSTILDYQQLLGTVKGGADPEFGKIPAGKPPTLPAFLDFPPPASTWTEPAPPRPPCGP